jgi:putative sigma-54 modulation protein
MRLTILAPQLSATDRVRNYVDQRVRNALVHVENRVDSVQIRLEDLNGPKGGIDKRCQVYANCGRLGVVRTEARDDDLRLAIDTAIDRAKSAVQNAVDKRMTLRRSKVPHRRAAR